MHVVCIGFSSDMEGILQAMGPKRQTLLFSATISSNIEGCVDVIANDPPKRAVFVTQVDEVCND